MTAASCKRQRGQRPKRHGRHAAVVVVAATHSFDSARMCSISTFAPQRRELRRWNDVLWCLPGRHVMPLRVDMPSSVLAPHGAGIVNQMPAGSTLGSCVRGALVRLEPLVLADTSCGGLLCSARLLVDGQKRNRRRLRDATSGPCPGGFWATKRNRASPHPGHHRWPRASTVCDAAL